MAKPHLDYSRRCTKTYEKKECNRGKERLNVEIIYVGVAVEVDNGKKRSKDRFMGA